MSPTSQGKPWLVFLHGPPGSGKLTIARELAAQSGFRLFHNHLAVDLVGSVFEFGSAPFAELREQIWLSVFGEAARGGVSIVFTFAPERTVRPGFVATTDEMVRAAVRCAEDELERRLADPSRAGFGKLQSSAHYRELRDSGAFEFPPLRPDVVVESDRLSPLEAARAIHVRLVAG